MKSLHYEDIIDEFAVLQLNPEKLVFDQHTFFKLTTVSSKQFVQLQLCIAIVKRKQKYHLLVP